MDSSPHAVATRRVNLFLIGVNKAGTSWLYYLLQQHPSVFMAEAKELYYFGNLDETGIDELDRYQHHFPFDESYQYYGDATVMYYRSGQVADEIQSYNPKAKVLAIVRDPIERLHSQFQYHKQIGILEEETSLAEALEDRNTRLIADSHYEQTLPAYAKRFGADQFKVVSLEAGREDPEGLWTELQDFLELSPIPLPSTENRPENPTGSVWFRRLYRWTVPPIRKRLPRLYRWMLTSRMVRAVKLGLLRLLGTDDRQELRAELRHRLRAEFAPTYAYLRDCGFTIYDQTDRQ